MTLTLASSPLIFMCPPDNLTARPDVHANKKEAEHYQGILANLSGFQSDAQSLWAALKTAYENAAGQVSVVPIVPGASDQTFTADPAFTLADTSLEYIYVVTSNFSNIHRHEEVAAFVTHLQNALKDHKIYHTYEVRVYEMETPFEGTGDNIYNPERDLVFSGYTTHLDENDPAQGRSSLESHETLAEIIGVDVVSLEVQYPCFHIDTCLGFLPGGPALVYRNGMTKESFDTLQQRAFVEFDLDPADYLIEVTQNEAENHMVTNFITIGKTIFMPYFGGGEYEPVGSTLKSKLDTLGYEIHWVDVSSFIKVGGAVHCISHLLHHRMPGGLLRKEK